MAEVKAPKNIRLQGGPEAYSLTITDGEGKPLEGVTEVTYRANGGGHPICALKVYGVELDVVADTVSLDRLQAAEEVARLAGVMLLQFWRTVKSERDAGRNVPGWVFRGLNPLEGALREWWEKAGKEPLPLRPERE